MRRIVLRAASDKLSLGGEATWVGCRWLVPALALFMLTGAVHAAGPEETGSPDAAPPSGVVIRLQLAPSTPAEESEQEPQVAAENDKTAAMSVQFRRQVGRPALRRPATNTPPRDHSPTPPQATPAKPVPKPAGQTAPPAMEKTLPHPKTPPARLPTESSVRQPAAESVQKLGPQSNGELPGGAPAVLQDSHTALQDSHTAQPPQTPTKPLELELHPPLELTSPADAAPDMFDALESSTELEPSQWDLSLDAPDQPRSSRPEAEASPETPANSEAVASQKTVVERGAQASDLSNERSLDSLAEDAQTQLQEDDVPLLHEPHPFDAPAGESIAPIVKRSTLDAVPFTQRELQIEAGIARCLSYYMAHPENTVRRGPWALMHATLPFGVEGEVIAGNRQVNTIGWLCFNGTSAKQNMFQPTRTGFRPNVGPGVQGHDGQFLAILAQAKVRGDFPLQINGRNYTVMDLARYEMATCREKSELTFKLIGLSRYLEHDAQWRDNRGRPWSLEKILMEEMAQPINGAACGGVHRLMGLSYAIIERQAAGQPITGNWQRTQTYLNNYVQYTLTLQNSDGSFSTNWFESRGMDPSIERRVQTTGHILEWLVYILPDEHLRSPQIQHAVEFLLGSIGREPQRDWPIGPRGHALRALSLYSQRVFGAEPGQLKSYLAEVSQATTVR